MAHASGTAGRKKRFWWVLLALLVIWILWNKGTSYWLQGAWFGTLGYAAVFWKILGWRWILGLGGGLLATIWLALNARLARRLAPSIPEDKLTSRWRMAERSLRVGITIGILLLGLIGMGNRAAALWDETLRYLQQVPFGENDPVFGLDLGFYVFSMPLYGELTAWLLRLGALTVVLLVVVYLTYDARTRALLGRGPAEEFWHTRDGSESRDVGVAVMGEGAAKRWQYQVGVYNGNGIYKDEKDNSDYMVVGRFVVTPFGEVPLLEVDPTRPDSPRLAVGLSAMSVTKGTEALAEEVEELTGGFELFFQLGGFNLLGEYFTRSEDLSVAIPDDEADVDGWYAQAGYLLANGFGFAGRYSATSRDTAGTEPEATEAGLALSYYFRAHRHKIQADYRQLEFDVEPMGESIDTDVVRVQLQLSF